MSPGQVPRDTKETQTTTLCPIVPYRTRTYFLFIVCLEVHGKSISLTTYVTSSGLSLTYGGFVRSGGVLSGTGFFFA